MSGSGHPEPGSNSSGPGAVGGVRAGARSRVLTSCQPGHGPPCPAGRPGHPELKGLPGCSGSRSSPEASAPFLWSLSGTTIWGWTLSLDRKEVEAAAPGLGARAPAAGPVAPQPLSGRP